jgi:uncharacterized protein YjiS (DUF1127 family)
MSNSYTRIGQQLHDHSRTSTGSLMVLVRKIISTVRIWRGRVHYRRELAARCERELRDMGTCWASIADEVSKPFWRG